MTTQPTRLEVRAKTMDQKTQMREGFEEQRKVGMNVDWFTWQIAWHDALFQVHDIAGDELLSASKPAAPFQERVQPWMLECFGPEVAADKIERNHRFFEEATEAVQANGMTRSEAHQLVDYTFDRPIGELHQEIGGVMVTLAALCLASGQDMHAAGETELARIWTKVEAIRAKQAAKPKHSPLPAAPSHSAEPFPYQKTFDAIAAATSVSAERVAISVIKFREAFDAAPQPSPTSVVLDEEREHLRDVFRGLDSAIYSAKPYEAAQNANRLRNLVFEPNGLLERAASPQPVAQPVEQTRALTDEQVDAITTALSLIGLSGDPRVRSVHKTLRALLTAARPARHALVGDEREGG
jgi:hypothetical protein